jgi:small subunit ribosomal protein S16
MAVVIRLRRMGAKKDPKFRIVVAESKSPRDGRFVDELGSYNAQPKEIELRVDAERAKYWLSVGATPSDQVKSLFKKAGIAMPVRATKPKKKVEAAPKAAAKAKTKAKGPNKRTQQKAARVAAKAAAPKKKPSAKKAAAKKAAKK